VLALPESLARWWPGVASVEPDRRGLAPGARWRVVGPNVPSYLRRPQANGTLLVLEAVPPARLAFQLVDERVEAELELRPRGEHGTDAALVVEAPWLGGVRRSFPRRALGALAAVVAAGRG
jgi:uncharacterized protein YndB with AHSA1/START domain